MKKLITFGLSAATILSMTGGALMPVAGALTIAELQAQIATLTAQIAAMGGSSSAACYAFTADLTEGSTGADVTALQNYLAGTGHFVHVVTGTFGPITKAAVAAWQTANGVVPAYGYFGPVSRAKYNLVCAPAEADGDGAADDFSGTAEGSLIDIEQKTSIDDEEVGEGDEDVEVLGVDFEADGADQMVQRVNVVFDNPGGVSDKLDDYISDVSLWLDGEELGRMDISDASYDRGADEYTFRFTGLEGLVEDGNAALLTVAVSGANSIDTGDEDHGWDVTILADGIRVASPNGTTETYDADPIETAFTVTTFATANDVELHAKRSSETPAEQTVIGKTDAQFDAELLAFDLEATGSEITVYGLQFELASVGHTELEMVDSLTLDCGSDSWSENVVDADDPLVNFGDIELAIDKDDTTTCTVTAMMNPIEDYAEGDSISVHLHVDQTDAEDKSGEALAGGELTGSANGYVQTMISEGISLSEEDTSATLSFTADEAGETSQGKFIMEFDVTANDTEVWLGSAPGDAAFTLDSAGGDTGVVDSSVFECVANCGVAGDNGDHSFYIDEGDTETYRLTVMVTAEAVAGGDQYKVWLDSLDWGTAVDVTGQLYDSNLGEGSTLDTGFLYLNHI